MLARAVAAAARRTRSAASAARHLRFAAPRRAVATAVARRSADGSAGASAPGGGAGTNSGSGGVVSAGRESVERNGAYALSPELAALFGGAFFVHFQSPVSWGEMDAFGHMNNVNYLRHFESARIDFYRQIGVANGRWTQFREFWGSKSVGPILKATAIKYRFPCTFPDTLVIGSAIPTHCIASDRFVMAHRAVSLRRGVVVADTASTLVAFNYQTRAKALLPPLLRDEFERFNAQHIPRANDPPPTAPGAIDPYALARSLVTGAGDR